ncbi:MAG TPA: DinB family protein [Candidatus Limnocylindria bacterium]|nr:DinB family protein [Candidatus Limnocylindria bacterium]
MNADTLLAFIRFHAWANDRILTMAAGMSNDLFRATGKFDHDSAFHTLRHLVDVDWSWREFCFGNHVGETYVWDHGFVLDDLPAIHAFCLEEDMRLRNYVESLDDTALSESLAIGADFAVPRWLILAHVVNHGTQHRSEVARYLTECGHSPGNLDLLDALALRWPGDPDDSASR